MHLALDSWIPHHDSEGWRQDLGAGLKGNVTGYNLVGETEEALIKINGMPSKGSALKKGELKMVRAAQHWLTDLQVLNLLTRDKNPTLTMCAPLE